MEQAMENVNKEFSRVRLSTVVSFAVLAGLLPNDQKEKDIDEIEIRGDFASLMQFTELIYQDIKADEDFEALMKKGWDDL
jgi:hypothetical protein